MPISTKFYLSLFQRLDQKLRDNLRDARNNLFAMESIRAGQLHASRPILLIADRLVAVDFFLLKIQDQLFESCFWKLKLLL